jgi:hypothetical protein
VSFDVSARTPQVAATALQPGDKYGRLIFANMRYSNLEKMIQILNLEHSHDDDREIIRGMSKNTKYKRKEKKRSVD